MAGAKRQRPNFRSQALAEALEHQDMAAVALALRNGNTIVPLMRPGAGGGVGGSDSGSGSASAQDAGEVWTYRDPNTGEIALLLFSDAKNLPENLPRTVGLHSPEWLHAFLKQHQAVITTVFLDVAGPFPMQASPTDLLRALEPIV